MKNKNLNGAFTLAEVLITLAIIGIVAALTIPTVVRNYQEKQTVVCVKKAYSQLSQAFQMATVEEGPINTWNWGATDNGPDSNAILTKMSKYLKYTKQCGVGTANTGCFSSGQIKQLGGQDYMNLDMHQKRARARLADGFSIALLTYGASCSRNKSITNSKPFDGTCGSLLVDINGEKKPNTLGKDLFFFYVTKYGVVPDGLPDLSDGGDLSNWCSTASGKNGDGCTYWILKHENMDYLKKTFICTGGTTTPWNCTLN